MEYTVKQLAKLAGVSVRTLHYYDEIGLLKPSFIKENGYRVYKEQELLRLQQILFFRELAFPLEDIIQMMSAYDFNRDEALREQKRLLGLKRDRITSLITTIDKTLKGGEDMKNDDLFASFDDEKMQEYMQEAKERWGHTDAYKQSMEKVKHWTKDDYERVKKEGELLNKELAEAMDEDIKSQKVQAFVEKHYKSIQQYYDCPYAMYRNLGEMYVSDPRFTATYDKFRPGLAIWLRDAIQYYCDQHEKKA